jgi:ADP-ribose pyrophosphatase YjhB (NUDIX family)
VKRTYPSSPVAGVASTVFKDDNVLLVRRGNPPGKGSLGLPGGVIELGETAAKAAVREVYEETGIKVEPVRVITVFDSIIRDDEGRIKYHYTLCEYLCRPIGGELKAATDVYEVYWAPLDSLEKHGLNPGTIRFIKRTAVDEGILPTSI